MKFKLQHPKTTLAGVAAILTGIGVALNEYTSGQPVNYVQLLSTVASGLGLVFGADAINGNANKEQQ